jgi:Tfp pilus assembly protein PilO
VNANRTTWIAGTALVALVLAAAAWLLVLSPRMTSISALNEEQTTTEDANSLLQIQVNGLAADAQRRDELDAELATLNAQFPSDIALPEFARLLDSLAASSGATVQSVTIGEPSAVTESFVLPDSPAGIAAPALPAPPAGMFAVPVSLTVLGNFDQAQAYAGGLQSGDQRLFLLSSLSWGTVDADGTSTFDITGYAYVLNAEAAAPTATESADTTPSQTSTTE